MLPNLSGTENTPELHRAIALSQAKGRGDWTFPTTIGHVVTKILEMDVTFTLPDGSQYTPFSTLNEITAFFHISRENFGQPPNRQIMDHWLSGLYRGQIQPRENAILNPRKEFVRNFFDQNVTGTLSPSDTMDALIEAIRSLADMGIKEISNHTCEDTIEWIIGNVIGTENTLSDWERMDTNERNTYTIDMLDIENVADYFVDCVVGLTWRKHPNNPYRTVEAVARNIRALYVVDDALENKVRGATPDSFRNTRYL